MFDCGGFDETPGEGRTCGDFGGTMLFFGGALFPGAPLRAAKLRLLDGCFNFEGLSSPFVVGIPEAAAIDIRDREGRRSCETG